MHAFHEIAIGEVPLLEHHPVAGVFQNLADLGCERRVGAGPADEEIRAGLLSTFCRPIHADFPHSEQ